MSQDEAKLHGIFGEGVEEYGHFEKCADPAHKEGDLVLVPRGLLATAKHVIENCAAVESPGQAEHVVTMLGAYSGADTAAKTPRSIFHIVAGSPDWEPDQSELEFLCALFSSALYSKDDAVLITKAGVRVKVESVQPYLAQDGVAGELVRIELADDIARQILPAVSLSDA